MLIYSNSILGVVMLCLPPHTTHCIQPLDVSFFKSLKAHWSTACHGYMVKNPGQVVTKFQFSPLFKEAWYKAIKPETFMAGFRKTGVHPFNPNAITVPAINSSFSSENASAMSAHVDGSDEVMTTDDDFTPPLFDDPGPSSEINEYSPDQLVLFQKRYENGYDVFLDEDYVDWLSYKHPEALPEHLCKNATGEDPLPVVPPSKVRVHCDDSEQLLYFESSYADGIEAYPEEEYVQWLQENHPDALSDGKSCVDRAESPSGTVPKEPKSSTPKSAQPGISSAISEFLTTPPIGKVRSTTKRKASAKKSIFGARVLTSAESLAMIKEKQRQKEEEEKAKLERKQEREIKKQQREAEKERKKQEMESKKQQREAEKERKNQEMESKKQQREAKKQKKLEEQEKKIVGREKMATASCKSKRVRSLRKNTSASVTNCETVLLDDISNYQCAVCFGIYSDDLVDDELIQTWVQCTLPTCLKWMHEDCTEKAGDKFLVCPLCNTKSFL